MKCVVRYDLCVTNRSQATKSELDRFDEMIDVSVKMLNHKLVNIICDGITMAEDIFLIRITSYNFANETPN